MREVTLQLAAYAAAVERAVPAASPDAVRHLRLEPIARRRSSRRVLAGAGAAAVLLAALALAWSARRDAGEFGGTPIAPERCAEGADLRLVFQASFAEEGGDILGLTVDGEVRQLTDDGGSYGPSFSPDGSQVAFTRAASVSDTVGAEGTTIHVMDVDGTNVRRLVDGELDRTPAWSPDGAQIAFVRGNGFDVPDRIMAVGPDGTGLRTLIEHDGPEHDRDPAWSPDGRHLAFVRLAPEGGMSELMVANADGSNPRSLLTADHAFGEPTWSPDSERVAFVEADEEIDRRLLPLASGDISALDLRSGDVRRITGPGRDPAWSPTGRIYAYAATPAVADGSGRARIAEFEPDGTGTFGTGRVVASIDPTGFPYGDAAVDVPACDRDAPPLTSAADVPALLTVTDPATGEDVQVLTREQAIARLESEIGTIPPDAEAKLVRSDDPTVLAMGVAPAGYDGIETPPQGPFVWVLGYDDSGLDRGPVGITIVDAATGASLLSTGGPDDAAAFQSLIDLAP